MYEYILYIADRSAEREEETITVSLDFGTGPHLDPDPFLRGIEPRIQICIRIHTKMLRIWNTANKNNNKHNSNQTLFILPVGKFLL
jgi:hypothetical protein